MIHFKKLLSAPLAALALTCGPAHAQAPPGMVLVEGGRTKIGAPEKAMAKLLEENAPLRKRAGAIWSATPEHTVQVDSFYLMVTEVTNEQYAEFVRATHTKPPEKWGAKAIDEARAAFLEEQGAAKKKAKEEGKPIPEKKLFDEGGWWNENWETAQWEIPEGTERKPVAYVDYQGARGYARWAGVRLPTEFEMQRAARGKADKDQSFPWGKKWESGRAATSAVTGIRGTFVVGSFPEGASPEGIHDLIGNVWEWTSSPYSPYPKFESKTFEFGKRKEKVSVDALPRWDANKRIAFGGCYHSGAHEATALSRAGVDRSQTADALGFRCAASPSPGIDIAMTVLEEDLPVRVRPALPEGGAVKYDVTQSLAADFWSRGIGAPTAINAGASKSGPVAAPDSYSIISGYDYMMFTPVEKLDAAQMNDLTRDTLEVGPAHIGFFSTNQRILEPDLQPGTYMVAIRMAGDPPKRNKKREKKDEEGEDAAAEDEPAEEVMDTDALVEAFGIDTQVDNLLFFDSKGEPAGALPCLDVSYEKLGKGHEVKFFDKDYTIVELDENEEEIEIPVHEEWVRFDPWIPGRVSRKGFLVGVGLRIEDELDTSNWRLPAKR